MKVLAWNVRWGGQDRAARIVDAIADHAPAVVVLSEYQPLGSAPILAALHAKGWSHSVANAPPPRRGGLAIMSRSPIHLSARSHGLTAFARHYLAAFLPEYGVELRAVYGPLHNDPHDQFWTEVLADLRSEADRDVLLIGDFNSGASLADSPVSNVFCAHHFAQLPDAGYIDLWRAHAGIDAKEHTWQGPKNPYRLDHAFGSASLRSRTSACSYSHEERLSGISDHSILTVEIESPAT